VPTIHPTAIVDSKAVLADGVTIGPFCIIAGAVEIGTDAAVLSHSVIHGPTRIGPKCKIGPGAYVGLDPQHMHFAGGETWTLLGSETIIREGAQVHRATKPGLENATRIGDRTMVMCCAHVAHDCKIGNDVMMANNAVVGGFVEVGDRAFLSAGVGVHQFCRVGRLAIIAGLEPTSRDVPPFAAMRYGGLKGYNAVGCRRSGMTREEIHAIRAAYQCLRTHRVVSAAVKAIHETVPMVGPVKELLAFIRTSKRGIVASVRWVHHGIANAEHEDSH
jgi:UDP-N-acetylglucosamine acyltransferase